MSLDEQVEAASLIEKMSPEQKNSQDFQAEDARTGLGSCKREAQIQTLKASLYLNKLCKHFTHRVPAHWNATQGKVFFDRGWCFMTATENALNVRCEAHSDAELEDILDTLKRHFDRFAIKDNLLLHWR